MKELLPKNRADPSVVLTSWIWNRLKCCAAPREHCLETTTAGAFNVTTRAASFTPGAIFEMSYGNYGFIQAKHQLPVRWKKKSQEDFLFQAHNAMEYYTMLSRGNL